MDIANNGTIAFFNFIVLKIILYKKYEGIQKKRAISIQSKNSV